MYQITINTELMNYAGPWELLDTSDSESSAKTKALEIAKNRGTNATMGEAILIGQEGDLPIWGCDQNGSLGNLGFSPSFTLDERDLE